MVHVTLILYNVCAMYKSGQITRKQHKILETYTTPKEKEIDSDTLLYMFKFILRFDAYFLVLQQVSEGNKYNGQHMANISKTWPKRYINRRVLAVQQINGDISPFTEYLLLHYW